MLDHMSEWSGFPRVSASVAAIIKGKDDIVVGLVENISLGGFYMHLQNQMTIEAGEAGTAERQTDGGARLRSIK
jgi:hypothetical protein